MFDVGDVFIPYDQFIYVMVGQAGILDWLIQFFVPESVFVGINFHFVNI